MNAELTGIVSPVLVPFDDAGDVDLDAVHESTRFTIECSADAVIAVGTGTAQEMPTLTVEERKALIAATIDATDGDVPVYAGVSFPSLSVVDDLIAFSEREGADGLFAMPPWGIPPDESVITDYFTHIDAATDLPVFLYNNPTVSVAMSETLMAELMELEQFVYIKESSRNWKRLAWMLDTIHVDGEAHVFTTLDVAYQTLEMGGAGITTPPPIAAKAREVFDAVAAGDTAAALDAQRELDRFPSRGMMLHAASKAAAEAAGVPVGDPRPPYRGATDTQREDIAAWMRDVGLSTDT
ncbi:dihydrodipicolinate synthase family protein [Salinigranum sp. GCM10025319]|uniref:dihydrodipicolinate synthase family protein n=1 Tax=Salinigranum sp. GCM10025319 TaxID=3252687 RepID=UPI00360A2409